jgi:hypothetical protein
LVVKYADNIHKGFSASIAIVIASVIDYFLFNDTEMNLRFAMGSFLVILSSIGYGMMSHSETSHSHASGIVNSSGIISSSNSSQQPQLPNLSHEVDRKGDIEGGKQF